MFRLFFVLGCFVIFLNESLSQEKCFPCDYSVFITIENLNYSAVIDSVPAYDTISYGKGKYFITMLTLTCNGRTEFDEYLSKDSTLVSSGTYGHFLTNEPNLGADTFNLKLNGAVEYFQDDEAYMIERYEDGVLMHTSYPLHNDKYEIVIPLSPNKD